MLRGRTAGDVTRGRPAGRGRHKIAPRAVSFLLYAAAALLKVRVAALLQRQKIAVSAGAVPKPAGDERKGRSGPFIAVQAFGFGTGMRGSRRTSSSTRLYTDALCHVFVQNY